jgi:ABC-2 type transport system ATP-binding protein
VAVDGLSFTVRAGEVTGFVGPNGAGKSTTMRLILGLDRPDEGEALVNGRPYRSLRTPLAQLGALLDASAVHPGRRGPRPPAVAGAQPTASARAGWTRCSTRWA